MARVGLYPGTFDPIHNGHADIMIRGSKLVDKLIVAVARNDGKGPLFGTDERVELVKRETETLDIGDVEIEVRPFDSLLVHFAVEMGASIIIRGLRAVSDFDYEFQMAGMNSKIEPAVDTVFLMASDKNQFISSRFVKEIGRLGGDIQPFVSPSIAVRLRHQFNHADKSNEN